jgi:pimeloyl-ACP methyl ester carboxylesterase
MALITPPASWLTGTPSDIDSLAKSYADTRIFNALTAIERDDPQTETDFQESLLRQAPASYAQWTDVEQAHANIGTVSLAAALAWFADIPHDVSELIDAMPKVPTLVIGGDRDFLTGVQPVEDYATLLAAELVMITNCGHYPWVEQADTFRKCLSSWLSIHAR